MTTEMDERKTFVSARGVTLTLRPVSQFKLDAVMSSRETIPVPQYQMTIAGGARVDHPMDAIIAKNQGREDEWNQYLTRVQEQKSLEARRFTELVLFEGVEIDVPGLDSEWQKTAEHFGIKLPGIDQPIERKLQYIYTETLLGGEDITGLISQILSVSQIPEEAIAKIRESFRTFTKRNTNQRAPKNKRKMDKHESNV